MLVNAQPEIGLLQVRTLTESVSLAVLLVVVGSVMPVGAVAVKVLVTLPVVAVTLTVKVILISPPLGKVGTTTVPASRLAMLN